MYLAVADAQRVSVSVIAGNFDISEHHVAKVASALARGGFVSSDRGRAGGLSLSRKPEDISIGAVVRFLTGDIPVVECFNGAGCACAVVSACGLRKPLADAQEAFYASLDEYSLNDVVGQRDKLRILLSV